MRRGAQEAPGLFRSSPRGGKTQHLLNILSDGHSAKDVEEYEGAVSVVLSKEIAVRQTLDIGQGHKGQLGHNPPIKNRVEHSHQGRKTEANGKHGLHSHHRQIPVVVL